MSHGFVSVLLSKCFLTWRLNLPSKSIINHGKRDRNVALPTNNFWALIASKMNNALIARKLKRPLQAISKRKRILSGRLVEPGLKAKSK